MDSVPEIVGEEVLIKSGPFMRIRRYFRGVHPSLGRIHMGLSGVETVAEVDVVHPPDSQRFLVTQGHPDWVVMEIVSESLGTDRR